MKKILILGATGSIGMQALDIVRRFSEYFEVVGLSAKSNKDLLEKNAEEFATKNIHLGAEGLAEFVRETDFDIMLNAVSGQIGVEPTLEAIYKGKKIALANKETLVAKGELIMREARKYSATIIPVDSEHSAIYQSLKAGRRSELRRVILTCSGGPFRGQEWTLERLKGVSREEALAHPNWSMGKKISIDSATLMNKALELIEAVRLFDVNADQVEVVVHPESIVHSAVEFCDGSVVAQMGVPDMRICIAYALFEESRYDLGIEPLSFFDKDLHFREVDSGRFPSILFARRAILAGESMCEKINRVNELAVDDFLNGKIGFLDIFTKIDECFTRTD
jgi:1-deoxy-D-xylulose-5-phosphate reductoisomerase